MDDVAGAVVAESPAADASLTEDTLPGAQSGAQPPVKEPPFHQHPRFQQLIRENGSLKGTSAAQAAKITELETAIAELRRTTAQPARTADERQQRSDAVRALKELMADDPDLAELLKMREELPKFREALPAVAELSKGQLQAVARQASTHIAGLVKTAGLQLDKDDLADLTQMVYRRATRIPGAAERFEQGDMEVLSEAFESVKTKFFGTAARAAATTTLDTKNQLRRLPPRTTGGAGGREAPPKLDPNADNKGVQSFTRSLAERARAVINGGG